MAGSVHTVPVQATVTMLYSSGVEPHDTITTGNGYIMVPGFHLIFSIRNRLSSAGEDNNINGKDFPV